MRGASNKPQYDPLPITAFFCKHHGVKDASQINVFVGCSMPSYALMRPTTAMLELNTGDFTINVPDSNVFSTTQTESAKTVLPFKNSAFMGNTQPKKPVVDPSTNLPSMHDLSRACVYAIRASWYQSSMDLPLLGRLNFVHKGLAEAEGTKESDRLIEAGGGTRGAFMDVHKTDDDGIDSDATAMYLLKNHYSNPDFIQMMALLNDQNLMNGIVVIPREVCEEARLPVFRGVPDVPDSLLEKLMKGMSLEDAPDDVVQSKKKELRDNFRQEIAEKIKDKKKVDHFVAIPYNHVLSWPLSSDEMRERAGYKCEQFRIKPKGERDGRILYYLLPDASFDDLVASFKETWLNKVDVRPLNEIALELLPAFVKSRPEQRGQTISGSAKIRLIMSFMSAPVGLSDDFIRWLAPIIPPGFVSIESYNMDRIAAEMAAKRHMEKRRL